MSDVTRGRRTTRGSGLSIFLLALVAVGGVPSRVETQTVDALVHRIDSLAPLHRQAERAADRAELMATLREQEELGITLDTIRVGPMRVAAPVEQVPDARRAFEEAWAGIGPLVGEATGPLDKTLWIFQYAPRLERIRLPLTPRGTGIQNVRVRSWRPWAEVKEAVESSLWSVLAGGVPRGVGAILAGWPWRPEGPDFLEPAYRELVTAPSRVASACVEGEVDACWTAMGADGLPETWGEWYSPAERRAMVLRSRPYDRERLVLYEACQRGNQGACDGYLEEFRSLPVPLTRMARSGLIGYALELGGAGSYERLVAAADEGLRSAVSSAAGLDPDEVMRRWRALVLEHRPEIESGVVRSQWSSLAWLLVFGILAMGSTRWRLA